MFFNITYNLENSRDTSSAEFFFYMTFICMWSYDNVPNRTERRRLLIWLKSFPSRSLCKINKIFLWYSHIVRARVDLSSASRHATHETYIIGNKMMTQKPYHRLLDFPPALNVTGGCADPRWGKSSRATSPPIDDWHGLSHERVGRIAKFMLISLAQLAQDIWWSHYIRAVKEPSAD